MTAYENLQNFKADLLERAVKLRERVGEINQELFELESEYDEAVIAGTHHIIQAKVDALTATRASTLRELQALENPPTNGKLGELIRAVWEEATTLITGTHREAWEAEIVNLEAAKADFLASVAKLAKIKYEADRIHSRAQELMLDLPGPKLAVPSLSTGIIARPGDYRGAIFIDHKQIAKIFGQ